MSASVLPAGASADETVSAPKNVVKQSARNVVRVLTVPSPNIFVKWPNALVVPEARVVTSNHKVVEEEERSVFPELFLSEAPLPPGGTLSCSLPFLPVLPSKFVAPGLLVVDVEPEADVPLF